MKGSHAFKGLPHCSWEFFLLKTPKKAGIKAPLKSGYETANRTPLGKHCQLVTSYITVIILSWLYFAL